MRNLQKILALVLALIMTSRSVATPAPLRMTATRDAYKDAVTVLNVGSVQGFDNGSTFQPKGNITARKWPLIYRIANRRCKDTRRPILLHLRPVH